MQTSIVKINKKVEIRLDGDRIQDRFLNKNGVAW